MNAQTDAPAQPSTLWTIGHSTLDFDEFVRRLRGEQVEVLADVRKLPGSRRYPHFDQDSLRIALEAEQIAYLHFPDLGGRRKPATDSVSTAWRHPAFRAYADYMATPEFERAIGKLTAIATRRRTAIMCAEAVWWRCHRSLIADYLKARGWRILHIMNSHGTAEHPFTSAARIADGELSYDATAGQAAR